MKCSGTPDLERPLPQSLRAERAVLDAMLSGKPAREVLLDSLQPAEFFDRRHFIVFEAMLALRQDGKGVDLLSVNERLESTGKLESAGGVAYLASLCGAYCVGADTDQAARSIREKAALRSVIYLCEATKTAAFEGAEDAAMIADRAINRLSEIARESKAGGDLGLTLREAAAGLLRELESTSSVRIFSDIAKLDETTGGWRPGELVILTGGTGHGKTLLAQQVARRACRDGHHSLYFSAEMRAAHLVSRGLAARAGVSPSKIRRPESLDEWEWKQLVRAASEECDICRIADARENDLTLARIRRVARTDKQRAAADLIVVDYDELVDVPGKDEWERQRVLVYGLKRLSMELACPLVLISQLRKSLNPEEAKRPTLEKLYGSGSKSKHASCVVYVDRPFVRDLRGDETAGKIFILKNRDGRVGMADVAFNVQSLRFESLPQPDGREQADRETR